MKKNKFLISIFICLSLFATFFCTFNSKNDTFAETSDVIFLSKISDIAENGFDKHYVLQNDIVFAEQLIGTFTGILDGAGHSLVYDGYYAYTNPLFLEVGTGAVIKNINIVSNENPFYVSGSGYISETITGATIENISFNNCALYADRDLYNRGFIAGVIKNSNVSNIKIANSIIENSYIINPTDPTDKLVDYNTNAGFIAGKALDGTIIKNCFVNNSTISLEFAETVAESFNFGGLVGCAENATFSNNIIDFYKYENEEVKETIVFDSSVNKTINFGGIAGQLDFDKNYIYNNVVAMDTKSPKLSETLQNSNVGAMIGNVLYEPYLTNIEGFVTTYQDNLFGKKITNNISYNKIIETTYEQLNTSIIQDSTLWEDREEYKWDFGKVWVTKAAAKFPTLQCFEKYSISFDSEESLKSLNLEVMPSVENNDYTTVVSSNVATNQIPTGTSGSTLSNIEYGSTLYIKINVSENKNYNKFFYIAGLQLNGKTIFDNINGSANENINVSIESSSKDGSEYIYKVVSFNANCEGTYNVLLGRGTYKIKVRVFNPEDGQTATMPGKFKVNSETNPIDEKIIDMQYGEKFVLSSYAIDTDYSDVVSWFIYDNSIEDPAGEGSAFSPVEANANFYSNKIEWTFNESSEIFRNNNTDDKTYFNISDYSTVDKNGITTSNYELILVYNKRVKEIKIVFRFDDNGEEITDKIANLLIDNKSDRLTWNEDEGAYYAKVAFNKESDIEYIIDIESMKTEYEFLSWSDNLGKLAGVEGDELAGIFLVSESMEEPLIIYCDVKLSKEVVGGNLLWLWIALGALALVVIIIVIIIIIKKRTGGGSSYKKYYY